MRKGLWSPLRVGAMLAAAGLTVAGCATTDPVRPAPPPDVEAVLSSGLSQAGTPVAASNSTVATAAAIDALLPADPVDVTLPPQPLPQMLDTVFGAILGLPYSLGPNIGSRTDVVTLRSAPGADKRALFRQVQALLTTYGLEVRLLDGAVQIVDASAPTATTLSARANPGPAAAAATTVSHRAVAVSPSALASLMTDVFPRSAGLTFTPDAAGDLVVVTGPAREVALAGSVIEALDHPRFAGVGVVRLQPVYWSAETLAEGLRDALAGEGYLLSDAPASARSVFVLAVPRTNQILVFAGDPTALQSARSWAGRLDRADALSGRTTTFVYQVRNTDAATLADLITATRGRPDAAANPAAAGLPGQTPYDTAGANVARPIVSGAFGDGRLAVDEGNNRIVFTGSAEAFTELRGLLVRLDTPRPQVLVEVTIAEVTLTDETRTGLEFFFTNSMSDGVLSGGTRDGLGLDGGGLSLVFEGVDIQAQFQAFASNNNVNILSRPRLVARSGDEARIQVGTDVPIITSRANSSTSTGGNTDILQTIQYRQTGVILRIRPIIYSDGRIDLEITQEVSSQQPNSNTTIASPLILNRSISTRLLVDEGATAVIGGLIDESFTTSNSGVPILKDIPLIGIPFRIDALSSGKTELVMLVTPHILRDGGEMNYWTDQATTEMNDAFAAGRGGAYTLTPFTGPRLRIEPDR